MIARRTKEDGTLRQVVSALLLAAALAGGPAASAQDDPAEVTIGERLFLETRFAQFFARNAAAT